jgi:hypothetical protein
MEIKDMRAGDIVKVYWYDGKGHESVETGKLYKAAKKGDALMIGPANLVRYADGRRANYISKVEFIFRPKPDAPFKLGDRVTNKERDWAKAYKVMELRFDKGVGWQVGLQTPQFATTLYYDPEHLVLVPDKPEPEPGTPIFWNGEWWARPQESPPNYYFSLTQWMWRTNAVWSEMQDTATTPGTPKDES